MSKTISHKQELTLRSVLLGAAITLIFTAANVYLGLRVGMTFASSIPAAVISMAALRAFKSGSIQENNIVQTVASAAGTLSSVIFVLPGLIMIGWWSDVPFWPTFTACAAGGILGVLYTIPLRRAMVVQSNLPYPEGIAAAEVLIVGMGSRAGANANVLAENRAGLRVLSVSALISALFSVIAASRVFASDIAAYLRLGPAATGVSFSFSLALLGAGHLVGLSVALATFLGFLIAWGAAVPIFVGLHPAIGSASEIALGVWQHQVRFIGVGEIAGASVWTLLKLMRPVWNGVRATLETARPRAHTPYADRDIPLPLIVLIGAACLPPLAMLLVLFLAKSTPPMLIAPLVIATLLYIVVMGFLVSAACGYMAGLIGSSNSPVSGLAIITVIGMALPLSAIAKDVAFQTTLIAYTLFVCSIVLCIATIANDNLQDLKTGLLVGATPALQQIALLVGVIMGAIAIPPVLELLNRAYGFAGAANAAHALPAPQATLISTLATGLIRGKLAWNLIGIGILIGLAVIALDEVRARKGYMRLPPLAIGLGIYLPASTTLPIVLGGVLSFLYQRRTKNVENPGRANRFGVLAASGLIVGESMFGVFLAAFIVVSGKASPLAIVGEAFLSTANMLGTVTFALCVLGLYAWIERLVRYV